MPGDSHFGQTFALAVIAHGAFYAWVSTSRPAARAVEPAPPALTLVPVEVEAEPPPRVDDRSAEPRTTDAPVAPGRTTVAPRQASTRATVGVVLAPGSPVEPEPGAAPAGTWSLHVTAPASGEPGSPVPLAALGLDGSNHFLGVRETPAQAEAAAKERSNREAGQAMRNALHASDVALGLGGGGPVISALEAAVRESGAPEECRAVLVAVADSSGVVTRVDVESASDTSAFASVADEVLKRLRGQKVRIPAGSRGLTMRVSVASTMALPSGGGVGLDLKNVGGHFDIADVAARPKRVIHARVVAEELL
jgi:hypothetical protein